MNVDIKKYNLLLCVVIALVAVFLFLHSHDVIAGDEPSEITCQGDSDCDGILDVDEDVNGNGVVDEGETDPKDADTDGDGIPDGIELKKDTDPTLCDTDNDGLSDGIELGFIQPEDKNGCHGLQPAGSNYKISGVMDPNNPDSDGDGLDDGEEDANGNGWVDPKETDPSLKDTDGDGISDGVEITGDFDGDGIVDFDFTQVHGEGDCLIPKSITDIDCDGISNARDDDSDGDGCPDSKEGAWVDANANGIPDIYDPQTNSCPSSASSGGGSFGALGDKDVASSEESPDRTATGPFSGAHDGSSCSLVFLNHSGKFPIFAMILLFSIIGCIISCRRKLF